MEMIEIHRETRDVIVHGQDRKFQRNKEYGHAENPIEKQGI